MFICFIILWTLSGILIFGNFKSENTRWAAALAFMGGVGGLSESIVDFFKPNLISYQVLTPILENILDISYIVTYFLANVGVAYTYLMFAICYSNLFSKKTKKFLYIILIIPSIVMLFVTPLYPKIHINFRVFSTWTVPYMIIGTILFVYSYIIEKSPVKKKDRLWVTLLTTVTGTFVMFTSYLARCFNITNMFRLNLVIISALFLLMMITFFRGNFLGVKLKFERLRIATYDDIIEQMSDGFIFIDEDMNILEVNNTFKSIFGNVSRGESFLNLLNGNTDLKKIKEYFLTNQKNDTTYFEEKFRIESEEKYYNIELNPISIKGKYVGTVILFKDITEHKKIIQFIKDNQEQIIEHARLESISQLIGGIAHNLKTPLMSSSGGIELINRYINNIHTLLQEINIENSYSEKLIENFNKVEKWGNHIRNYLIYMNDVISTVKDQISANEKEHDSFYIKDLLNKINILMNDELKKFNCLIKYEILVSKDLEVLGSINYLLQVLNNLISNAKDSYDGNKGIIDFIIKADNDKIYILVQDYGRGIPNLVKDKIFKQMVTTKGKNGSGLGLYISQTIIKTKFKGEIDFESKEGEGSTFIVILPLHKV